LAGVLASSRTGYRYTAAAQSTQVHTPCCTAKANLLKTLVHTHAAEATGDHIR